jgi:SAM-dependent methyltransferase
MSSDVDLYVRVRRQEGRLYSDEIVERLPLAPPDHPLRSEWCARAASSDRLTGYLRRRAGRASILEIGCGNGWLSNRMAACTGGVVVGLDRESAELRQARRVFADNRNLSWISADIHSAPFPNSVFAFVVIACAIQYFEDLPRLISSVMPLLSVKGEIHILDSPLYSLDELPSARRRSERYYEQLGFPEMTAHYHHHPAVSLDPFNPEWLYVPRSAGAGPDDQLRDSPFPWVCLRPER